MGIYINGMEMPKNDEMLCIKIYPNGKVAIEMDLECKQIATAVSVSPHGRLIDAVPVVRCKDCVFAQGHFTNAPVKCGCGYGTHHEEFFCAGGERRTDDA